MIESNHQGNRGHIYPSYCILLDNSTNPLATPPLIYSLGVTPMGPDGFNKLRKYPDFFLSLLTTSAIASICPLVPPFHTKEVY